MSLLRREDGGEGGVNAGAVADENRRCGAVVRSSQVAGLLGGQGSGGWLYSTDVHCGYGLQGEEDVDPFEGGRST